MRRHHQGYSLGGHKFEQQLKHLSAGCFVERTCGFVCQQDLRPVHQRPAERGALALAAGQLLDAVAEARREAGTLRKLLQSLLCGAAVCPGCDGWNQAILFEREPGNQIMKLKDEAHLVAEQAQPIAAAG